MIGKKLYHEKYGELAVKKKRYSPIGNSVVFVAVDKKGIERKLDGTEIPLEEHIKKIEQELENQDSQIINEALRAKKEKEKKEKEQQELAEKEAEREEKDRRHTEVLSELKNASESIVEAVTSIPQTVIPEFPKFPEFPEIPDHYKEQSEWQEKVLEALRIEIPEFNDEKIISAIKNIRFPEMKDYGIILQEIKDALPKDTDLSGVINAIQTIPEYPFQFKDGRLKVEVDRVSLGGGGGLSSADSQALQSLATEETLQDSYTNHICQENTTSTPLGAGETFTGEWQDCLNYQEVNVSVYSDKNSATNGLVIEWSDDGVTACDDDKFSVYANAGTNYTPNPAFRYVRVRYTNGATPQTTFHLMTILRRGVTGGSFHRIDSTLKDDSDARLNITIPKLKRAAGDYVSQTATSAGNAKISLEEYDEAFIENPLPVTKGFNVPIYDEVDMTYVASGNGAGEIETVIFSLEGTPHTTLTFTYDANDNLTKVLQT